MLSISLPSIEGVQVLSRPMFIYITICIATTVVWWGVVLGS